MGTSDKGFCELYIRTKLVVDFKFSAVAQTVQLNLN